MLRHATIITIQIKMESMTSFGNLHGAWFPIALALFIPARCTTSAASTVERAHAKPTGIPSTHTQPPERIFINIHPLCTSTDCIEIDWQLSLARSFPICLPSFRASRDRSFACAPSRPIQLHVRHRPPSNLIHSGARIRGRGEGHSPFRNH